MSLESIYFNKNFHYRARLVNKYIAIIRYSKNEKRVRAFKNLLFKMMKDIAIKNIANYLNLLQNIEEKNMPDRDELVSECYIIFDKCVNKFVLNKTYNFYFYFNKSLSRSFFRDYQKLSQRTYNHVEMSESVMTVNKNFHDKSEPDTTELLMEQLGLTFVEMRICRSRMIGQKTSEFLEENTDITNGQYSRSLKKIKSLLIESKEKGDI